ncbi:MAG: hypothetical protein QOC77_1380 [Thermoleophilaceae bacterium]|nr:hypothetical protein [Thermoleophilaceae bacterium]
MRYWLLMLGGLLLAGVSVVLLDNGLFHLVRTGNCGSSNTYVSYRPCPPGTGGHILAVIGGIFGGLIGIGLYAARGRSGGTRSSVGLGLIMWSLLFVTIAGSVAYAAYGPGNKNSSGAKTTAVILGVIFLPMGLAPLPFALAGRRKSQQFVQLTANGKHASGVITAVHDTGITVNDNPRVKMTVRVEPPAEAPFTIEKTSTVSRVSIPRVGDRCSVYYDPTNPQHSNAVTFTPAPGFATAFASVPQPAAPAAPAAAANAEDPLEQIAKLGQLRDRGLLTPAEFEAQKKRLLNET